ncbi:MAG: bifunctional demethylmenaquinone methyltransferase/2-methoxy-6-polyprenyl-1,4-benzoquinol methylase UbiE [Bdellovibrionales bacterium]|nr:bifunctional demethylmenaquinone methyltransferase/2-methoxy-6-polyprenyl-1,4-benzoquinol methylase UbiE [Bdellovibrionales bacterium]
MDKREQTIKNMFSEIAESYDQANSVLSLGIHHVWKKKLVKMSGIAMGGKVLDCATGTGDLAIEFKKVVGDSGEVIGTDFCQEMLDVAPAKAKAKNLDIQFRLADASALPFDENQFDVTSISFGIRNVEQREMAIKDMARVTKSGGRVMILEFGQIRTPVIRDFYNFYSHKVLPWLGGVISGKPKAYQYLNDSSQVFPCGQDFADEIMSTGMYEKVSFTPLSFGIAYIYTCIVK